MVLGGQFVSRINLNLREDKGFTYGARTVFDFRRAPARSRCRSACRPTATAEAIRESIGEIAAIRGPRPVTADELALGTRRADARLSRATSRPPSRLPAPPRSSRLRSARRLLHDLRAQGAVADRAGRHRDRMTAKNLFLDADGDRPVARSRGSREVGWLWEDSEPDAIVRRRHELMRLASVSLPPMQRLVLALRELEGLTYAEIASLLDLSDPAVGEMLAATRERLRVQLGLTEPRRPQRDAACAAIVPLLSDTSTASSRASGKRRSPSTSKAVSSASPSSTTSRRYADASGRSSPRARTGAHGAGRCRARRRGVLAGTRRGRVATSPARRPGCGNRRPRAGRCRSRLRASRSGACPRCGRPSPAARSVAGPGLHAVSRPADRDPRSLPLAAPARPAHCAGNDDEGGLDAGVPGSDRDGDRDDGEQSEDDADAGDDPAAGREASPAPRLGAAQLSASAADAAVVPSASPSAGVVSSSAASARVAATPLSLPSSSAAATATAPASSTAASSTATAAAPSATAATAAQTVVPLARLHALRKEERLRQRSAVAGNRWRVDLDRLHASVRLVDHAYRVDRCRWRLLRPVHADRDGNVARPGALGGRCHLPPVGLAGLHARLGALAQPLGRDHLLLDRAAQPSG